MAAQQASFRSLKLCHKKVIESEIRIRPSLGLQVAKLLRMLCTEPAVHGNTDCSALQASALCALLLGSCTTCSVKLPRQPGLQRQN